MSLIDVKNSDSVIAKPKLVFPFLDGLRGVAALYVMVSHALWEIEPYRDKQIGPTNWYAALSFLNYGHYAVGVFIVLSGFLLMLPVVTSDDKTLRGGIKEFFKRRAKRILPGYYAALCLSSLLIICVPAMRVTGGWRWDMALPAFSVRSIITHLLLVHTFWGYGWTIDPVLWSIAIEWWIYVIFALLLVPIFRRAGIAGLLTACLAMTIPFLLNENIHFLPARLHVILTSFQSYILLFGFGATAAWMASVCPTTKRASLVLRMAVLFSFVLSAFALYNDGPIPNSPFGDIMVGLSVALMIVTGIKERQLTGRPTMISTMLESRPVRMLAAFSYSLYLVHFPIQSLLHVSLRHFGASPSVILLTMMTAGVGLSLAFGFLFYLAFEKPFIGTATNKAFKQKSIVG